MIGQKILCGGCYGDPRNHSRTGDTILASASDLKYVGSPDHRECEQCRTVIPYAGIASKNPQADPFTGQMRVMSQCCNEPIVQAGFMSETWPVCSGCHQPIGNRGPNKSQSNHYELDDMCAECGHRYDWHREHGWCNARKYSQAGHCPCYEFKADYQREAVE